MNYRYSCEITLNRQHEICKSKWHGWTRSSELVFFSLNFLLWSISDRYCNCDTILRYRPICSIFCFFHWRWAHEYMITAYRGRNSRSSADNGKLNLRNDGLLNGRMFICPWRIRRTWYRFDVRNSVFHFFITTIACYFYCLFYYSWRSFCAGYRALFWHSMVFTPRCFLLKLLCFAVHTSFALCFFKYGCRCWYSILKLIVGLIMLLISPRCLLWMIILLLVLVLLLFVLFHNFDHPHTRMRVGGHDGPYLIIRVSDFEIRKKGHGWCWFLDVSVFRIKI